MLNSRKRRIYDGSYFPFTCQRQYPLLENVVYTTVILFLSEIPSANFIFKNSGDLKNRKVSYIRRKPEYLIMWDKPGTNSAPGRFYNQIRKKFGDEVRFIQRSVYGTDTLENAKNLAELAKNYGLNVLVFRVVEVPNIS